MSKGSRNRSAGKAYWESAYWASSRNAPEIKPSATSTDKAKPDEPNKRAKPITDGGEAVKEIKRLVGEQCKPKEAI